MLNKVSLTCVDGVLQIEFAIVTVVIEFSVALFVVYALLQSFTLHRLHASPCVSHVCHRCKALRVTGDRTG